MKNNILSINEYRNNPEFYFLKGLRLANKKNLSEAYRNLIKALELEPDNSEYKFSMACFLSELKRPDEANRLFNDILVNYEPSMFDCLFGLGCNSFEEGNNEKAAEYFDKYTYFDAEGEFSYEISELAFYLKLYNNISHDNKFLKNSRAYLRRALKCSGRMEFDKAIDYLYKSVLANPMNLEARNQLTFALMVKNQYIRAAYINSSAKAIDEKDIWALCLEIFILNNSNKTKRAKRILDILPHIHIESREEFLCILTTLAIFGRYEELTTYIETYIVDFSEALVYSILLLMLMATGKKAQAEKLNEIIASFNNLELKEWAHDIISSDVSEFTRDKVDRHYKKIFSVCNETVNNMYCPDRYIDLLCKDKKITGLPRKYMTIIEAADRNREIVYSRFYKKEILSILSEAVKNLIEPLRPENNSFLMYSAALEYIYCKLFNINMKKKEIITKYNVTKEMFEKAYKILTIQPEIEG